MRRIALVVVMLASIGLAVAWFTRTEALPVVLKEVAAGTVEACQRTKLSTIIGGRIEYLGVKEGDKVKKGQLLLKLWNDDQQANAALAQTQIVLAARRSDEACIVAVNAENEAKRQADLRARGFVSASREEAARTEADVRRAACNTSKADVAQAEARLKATRVEQGRVALYAPFDGTVAKIVGELGEYSTPSPPGVPTPPAIDLIDDSCLYVKAPMDEVDAPKISAGQTVRISLDALPGKQLAGKVRRVAPYVSAIKLVNEGRVRALAVTGVRDLRRATGLKYRSLSKSKNTAMRAVSGGNVPVKHITQSSRWVSVLGVSASSVSTCTNFTPPAAEQSSVSGSSWKSGAAIATPMVSTYSVRTQRASTRTLRRH